MLVPYFLIEKNAKYIFGAGGEWIWQMGKFSQKGNFSPYDRELFFGLCFTLTVISPDQFLIKK